jgi:serine/threonine protein kinase/Tol biopolymer transport system component
MVPQPAAERERSVDSRVTGSTKGATTVADDWIGRELAGYRIERLVGRGGMGVVYLAEDTRLGRRVALKLLSPDLAEDAQFRDRFVRESRLAALLEHPNIVPIHAAGESEGVLYIAMRFIEGTDLRALLEEQGALRVERAYRITSQIAAALDAAHAQGLVHRDVKPGNVLIGDVGGADHCYLSDFGLTKQQSSMTGLTVSGQIVGTVDYLAPETIEGGEATPASDQYALGCVLYECLTGAPPFHRKSDVATLWAHVRDDPPSLSDAGPDLEPVDPIIRRSLQKKPERRYESCAALSDELRAVLPDAPAGARISRRTKIFAGAAFAVAVLATAILTAGLTSSSPPARFHAPPADSVVAFDPGTGKLVGSPIRVGRGPDQIVASGHNLWVASEAGRSVSLIDSTTRRLVRTIPLSATPTSIAPGPDGSVWVDEGLAQSLEQITPVAGGGFDHHVVNDPPRCCPGPSTVIANGSTLWIGDAEGIRKVDVSNPVHPTWQSPIISQPSAGSGVIGPGGTVYFSDGWNNINSILYGSAPVPASQPIPGAPSGLTASEGAVWYALPGSDQVVRLQPNTQCCANPLTTTNVPGEPIGLAVAGRALWVASALSGDLTEINPGSVRVTRAVHIGGRLSAIAATGGMIWVAVQSSSAAREAAGSIAFHSPDHNDIEVVRANGGSQPRRLVRIEFHTEGMPDFSPDGSRFVYIRSPGTAPSEVWVADADGTHLKRMTSPRWGPGDFGPSWSPDGRWIAVWRDVRDNLPASVPARNDLVVMHPDGTDAHTVFTLRRPFLELAEVDWSPDGRYLLIQENTLQLDGQVAVIPAAGGNPRVLTAFPGWSPRWSPDGTRIAYVSSIDNPGVYVTGVHDPYPVKLASMPDLGYGAAGTLAWSPDGRELTYADYDDGNPLHVIFADGTGDTAIANGADLPAWRPYQ